MKRVYTGILLIKSIFLFSFCTPAKENEISYPPGGGEEQTDPALVAAVPNIDPLPRYGIANLDFVMMCGGVERTRVGRLWAFWTAGGDSEKAYTVMMYSDNNGNNWSDVVMVLDAHTGSQQRKIMGGCLWFDPQGRLWAFYGQSMTYFDGRSGTWYTRCDNPDADRPVWSKPVRIWHGSATSHPILLGDDSWMLPVTLGDGGGRYPELDPYRGAGVLCSSDGGITWEYRGGVVFPQSDYNEHSIVELQDGRIWMTARTKDGIWQSFSADKGFTWSEPAKYHAHNRSRHYLRRLSSGNLILIKHGDPDVNIGSRSHLKAFISKDEGRTWVGGLELDERKNVAYPYGCQAAPGSLYEGLIYIVYDRNREDQGEILMARFTEEDVLQGHLIGSRSKLKIRVAKAGYPQE